MYCPVCRVEYRDGFTQCRECDARLVSILPPPLVPTYENLVSVFDGDANDAVVARSAVEDAGINSWVRDDGTHGLFPSLGSAEILVASEDEKPARKVIESRER